MLKVRLIPVLLLKNGMLVRSEGFRVHQIIGNPIHEVERFNEWAVDELIYLDISRTDDYDVRRGDARIRGLESPLEILKRVSLTCFVPLTWGGRIRSVDDMALRFVNGADKITVNTAALRDPALISAGAARFGSQAVVLSMDVARREDGGFVVMSDGGTVATNWSPVEWALEAERRGCGEILVQSVERDGAGRGYDLGLISAVAAAVKVPVIACSGVGTFEHYAAAVRAGASAVAAANIWHFKELADRQGKRALARAGIPTRT